MERKTKVCVITAAYPLDESIDGVFIKDHCKMLKEQGFDVSVLYAVGLPVKECLKDKRFGKIIQVDDEDVDVRAHFNLRQAATYLIPITVATVKRSACLLFEDYLERKGKPDVIITHFAFPGGIGAAHIAKKYQIPLIVLEHLSLFLTKARPWMNSAAKKVYDQAEQIVCVSEALKTGIRERFRLTQEIQMIPNVLDSRFQYLEPKEKRNFVFLSVGNLVDIKNHELTIEAYTKAFGQNENISLRIAGNGPLEDKLQEKIEELDMQAHIKLLGKLGREEVRAEMQNCDCFVLLSKNETFGIVYREAMAVGRPVISSNNGGIHNGWEDAFGVIIEENSVDCAAQAMIQMRENLHLYDGAYLAKRMNQMYAQQAVGQQYKDLINGVIAKNAGGAL